MAPGPSPPHEQQHDGRLNPGGRPLTWLWWLAVAAAAGAAALAFGPGFELDLQLFRISAHNPRPLAVAALVAAAIALARRRGRAIGDDLPALLLDMRRYALGWAIGIAALLAATAVAWNTWTIAGSDSHCYAAQARAFVRGSLHVTQPLALSAPWPDATRTFTPIGFIPSETTPGQLQPICAPGYSLLITPLVAASPTLQFLVAPAAAALMVVAAFLLARRVCDSPLAGLGAAALCAATPVVLFQAMQPMTDIPAGAALSAAAVFALARPPRARAAGMALGLCLLIRPNLLPVALPFLVWLWSQRTRLFSTFLPLAALVPVLNALVYGHPLKTGYGDSSALFSLHHVPENLLRYPTWLVETMTPLVALSLIAPWLMRMAEWPEWTRRSATALLTLTLVVFACYVAYLPFDEWWYLRFLLPAIPAICALTAGGLFATLTTVRGRSAITLLVLVVVSGVCLREAHRLRVFDLWWIDQRMTKLAEHLASHYPRPAAIALQASGAISYRLEQPVVRWDNLRPGDLDTAIGWLRQRGFHPLIVVDYDEDEQFRRRFVDHSPFGDIDWPPSVVVHRVLRLYDPAEREPFAAGRALSPTYIDPPLR